MKAYPNGCKTHTNLCDAVRKQGMLDRSAIIDQIPVKRTDDKHGLSHLPQKAQTIFYRYMIFVGRQPDRPYVIAKVYSNGTVQVRRGVVSERLKIRRLTPFRT
jgi:hypothetical protein